jgi:hypothetical protein
MKIHADPRVIGNPQAPTDLGLAEEGLRNSIGLRVGQLCTLALLRLPDTPIGVEPTAASAESLAIAGTALGVRIRSSIVSYVRQYEGSASFGDDDAGVVRAASTFLVGLRAGLSDPEPIAAGVSAPEVAPAWSWPPKRP